MNITTSFSPGDKIFVLQYESKLKQIICGACGGKGTFTGRDGLELTCPKCRDGFQMVREKSQYHIAGPLTIFLESIAEHPDVQRLIGQVVELQAENERLKEKIERMGKSHLKSLEEIEQILKGHTNDD